MTKNNRERAKDLLPAIILTVLSMIQALALEIFWAGIERSEFLWQGGLDAIIGWLQLLVMLTGILLIWVFHVSFVLRFTWLPSMEDTLIPFFLGLLEFAMIDLMGPGLLGLWFPLLGAVFGVATYASHLIMRQARREPANDYFFSQVTPASWRDYRLSMAVIFLFILFGPVIWACDNNQLLSIGALLFAAAALLYQFVQARKYWMHSLTSDPSDAEGENG